MQIVVNGQSRQVPAGISVRQLLDELQLLQPHVAVEVNLDLVPRTDHAQFQLNDGDRLEIVTLAGGG